MVKGRPCLARFCLSLLQELEINTTSSTLFAESAATMMSIHLLRHRSTHPQSALSQGNQPPNHQLNRALEYIHSHLTTDISLEAIATCLGISRYHLCRMFKQSMGLSPHQYVLQQRIERSKQMLKERKLRLSEIAIACEFSHQSHFNYHFKRVTGVTPRSFLRAL